MSPSDGRERFCKELSDKAASEVASKVRASARAEERSEKECDELARAAFIREYEEVFAECMAGGS